jgi:hypothetical protein
MIIPADFPELALLLWNRDLARPLSASDAFAIYERNWRFVDQTRLTNRETQFIRDLTNAFGNGVLLAS